MSRTSNPPRRRSLPTPLPNAGRAAFATFAVLFASAVDAVHGVFYGYVLSVWGTVEDPTTIEQFEQLLTILQFVALIVGGIGFIRWFRRAYGNAIALGHRASHTPGWAIGGWFVPFLNLVRPYQAGMRLGNRNSDDSLRLSVQLDIAADATTVVAGVLAVVLLRKLTRAHEAMVPESAAEVFA